MTICIDWDEVINSFVTAVLTLYNEDSGDNLTIDDITDYQIAKAFKPEYKDKLFDYFDDPRCIESLQWEVGWVVKLIQNKIDDIYFVTATHPKNIYRKFLKCLQALNDAGLCISEQELCQRLVTTTNKRLIKTDILIDDCFDNLHFDGVTHNILVAKPWNVKLMQMFGEQYGNHHIVLCEDVNDIPQIVEQIREERRQWDIT